MRIIAGLKRGMKLLPPAGRDTRPITDRVKESLFSVLYKYDVIEDCVVSDIFCGTGSLGLEALSRGAKWATFIDKDRKVIQTLNKNISKAGFEDRSKVITANAFKVGSPGTVDDEKCDLVFIDPPYVMSTDPSAQSQLGRLLEIVCDQIKDTAIVCVRTYRQVNLLDNYGQLKIIDRRQWGSMAVTLLQLAKNDTAQPVNNDDQ